MDAGFALRTALFEMLMEMRQSTRGESSPALGLPRPARVLAEGGLDCRHEKETPVRHKKQMNLLIADNDENVLIALERVFEDERYATTTVASHEEIVTLMSQVDFDLIVLDDHLSDADSIQVLTDFQRVGLRPVVIVTFNRYPAQDQRARLRDMGVSAVIRKTAHPEMVDIARHLRAPRPHVCRDDSMT
jgi:CheY-like chemotaxis protein